MARPLGNGLPGVPAPAKFCLGPVEGWEATLAAWSREIGAVLRDRFMVCSLIAEYRAHVGLKPRVAPVLGGASLALLVIQVGQPEGLLPRLFRAERQQPNNALPIRSSRRRLGPRRQMQFPFSLTPVRASNSNGFRCPRFLLSLASNVLRRARRVVVGTGVLPARGGHPQPCSKLWTAYRQAAS